MSKSTGNFMTLEQAVEKFSADGINYDFLYMLFLLSTSLLLLSFLEVH